MRRVADSKQRDIGHSKVRIGNEMMDKLTIRVGDFIELHGKRTTVAMAWPAYDEDQGLEIVRMDGLLRRNAGVAINEDIAVKKAELKDSEGIIFAPSDVRLRVDAEFVGFVKRRFMNLPFVEGDMTLISIFGSAVPLIVTRTRPNGPVKITESTIVEVTGDPVQEEKGKRTVNLPQDRMPILEKDLQVNQGNVKLEHDYYFQISAGFVRKVLEEYEKWDGREHVPDQLRVLMRLLHDAMSRRYWGTD